MLLSCQESQEIETSTRMFRSAMRLLVNITLMRLFRMLKALASKMLPCSQELFPALLALPGSTWMRYARMKAICHPCHSNNYGLSGLLCHILRALHMTHHPAGKQEMLHLGEEVKGCHTSGQYPSYPSRVVILIHQATPKQGMFNHSFGEEDQAVSLHYCLTSETPSCDKERQPNAPSTDPIPR